jgi:DNA polymerase V
MKSTWRKAPSIYNSRKLFKADHRLLYRRLGVCADNVKADPKYYQLNMFIDYEALAREKQLQGAISELRST